MIAFRKLCGWVALACLFVTIAIIGLFANPSLLFAHKYEAPGLTLYTDQLQNEMEMRAVLTRVSDAMAKSELGPSEKALTVYATNTSWRESLFFAPVPKAGGVVYPLISGRHAFLTGIDPGRDMLIKGTYRIKPPRTLTFYMVHELTHLRMHQMSGTIGFYTMPHWIREGLPDYVALGPLAPREMAEIINWSGPSLERIKRFGAYPVERAAVSYAVNHLGFSPEALMSEQISLAEMLGQMRRDGIVGAL